MLIPSHTVLANRISDFAKEQYGFHFVLNAIYRGSIMPDFKDKEPGSHYEDACFISASSLWDEICALEGNDLRVFSYKVGQMLHFVADYFTNAHNKKYLQKNMRRHMLYEMRLHFLLSKWERIPKVDFKEVSENPMEQIKMWHDEYMVGRGSIEKDLRFAIRACFFLADMVVAEQQEKRAHRLLAA